MLGNGKKDLEKLNRKDDDHKYVVFTHTSYARVVVHISQARAK